MNKTQASKLAEIITNAQLKQMLDLAKSSIKNWQDLSKVYAGFTKGAAWNILGSNFDVNKEYLTKTKKDMILEYQDYLPKSIFIQKDKSDIDKKIPIHEEPIF